MSRRKPNKPVAHVDGVVRILCPSRHVVGMVVAGGPGDRYILSGPNFLKGPGIDHSVKVRLTCPTCAENGKHVDLQGSWPRLRELADENAADQTRPYVECVLGG